MDKPIRHREPARGKLAGVSGLVASLKYIPGGTSSLRALELALWLLMV